MTMKAPKRCTAPGCERNQHCRGLCVAHYRRLLRGSNMRGALGSRGGRTAQRVNASVRVWLDADAHEALREESEVSGRAASVIVRDLIERWAARREAR